MHKLYWMGYREMPEDVYTCFSELLDGIEGVFLHIYSDEKAQTLKIFDKVKHEIATIKEFLLCTCKHG
jgi:hypothetical protein